MKVESTFVIEEQIVAKTFQNSFIVVYETKDQETLYIVSNSSGEVITKIDMECSMSQGCGLIENITYTDMSDVEG